MIFLKLKLWYQRFKIERDYDYKIRKNGKKLFNKEKEMEVNFLNANKRRDVNKEAEYQGWLDCLGWLTEKKR